MNAGAYHAQRQGAHELAVEVAVPWIAVPAALPLQVYRRPQPSRVQHRVRRRNGDEGARLEDREGEYSESVGIPHERSRRLHGDAASPSKRSRTSRSYFGPREAVKAALEPPRVCRTLYSLRNVAKRMRTIRRLPETDIGLIPVDAGSGYAGAAKRSVVTTMRPTGHGLHGPLQPHRRFRFIGDRELLGDPVLRAHQGGPPRTSARPACQWPEGRPARADIAP